MTFQARHRPDHFVPQARRRIARHTGPSAPPYPRADHGGRCQQHRNTRGGAQRLPHPGKSPDQHPPSSRRIPGLAPGVAVPLANHPAPGVGRRSEQR